MVNLTTSPQFFPSSKIFSRNSTGFPFLDSASHFLGQNITWKLLSKGKKRPRSWTVTIGGTL